MRNLLRKKLKNLEKIKEFEHVYNPIHLYCRAVELGVKEETAYRMIKEYERDTYQPLIRIILSR